MNNKYFEAAAPGRLDVMGGIADYSGALVLQMPIAQQTKIKSKSAPLKSMFFSF